MPFDRFRTTRLRHDVGGTLVQGGTGVRRDKHVIMMLEQQCSIGNKSKSPGKSKHVAIPSRVLWFLYFEMRLIRRLAGNGINFCVGLEWTVRCKGRCGPVRSFSWVCSCLCSCGNMLLEREKSPQKSWASIFLSSITPGFLCWPKMQSQTARDTGRGRWLRVHGRISI